MNFYIFEFLHSILHFQLISQLYYSHIESLEIIRADNEQRTRQEFLGLDPVVIDRLIRDSKKEG